MPRQTEVQSIKRKPMFGAPVTGQTALYSSQMQQDFAQNMYERGVECYCLDATDCIPEGSLRNFARNSMALANWVTR